MSGLPLTWTPIAQRITNPERPKRGPNPEGEPNILWVTVESSPLDYSQAVRLRKHGKLLTALRGDIMMGKKAKGR